MNKYLRAEHLCKVDIGIQSAAVPTHLLTEEVIQFLRNLLKVEYTTDYSKGHTTKDEAKVDCTLFIGQPVYFHPEHPILRAAAAGPQAEMQAKPQTAGPLPCPEPDRFESKDYGNPLGEGSLNDGEEFSPADDLPL